MVVGATAGRLSSLVSLAAALLPSRIGLSVLGKALIGSTRSAERKKDTYLAARYSRLASRRGPNKAAVAAVQSMVTSARHTLRTGEHYREAGGDYFIQRHEP